MASELLGAGHVSRVRYLYKVILRLHRGLPTELKGLGDDYVKSEFRRHKTAKPEFIIPFMKEWSKYALEMAKQLQKKDQKQVKFGQAISPQLLDSMSDEQVGQIYELFNETKNSKNLQNLSEQNPATSNNNVKPGAL